MSKYIDVPYNRTAVASYATQWAFSRNPAYYDFHNIGGDCTNFASQCIFAGCGVMNYTHTYGWYYSNLNNRSPSWTSVRYLYQFLTQNQKQGPYGYEADISEVEIGDIVQIKFNGKSDYTHTPVIVDIIGPKKPENIYISAHTYDSNHRRLSTYENVNTMRYIHISGARR